MEQAVEDCDRILPVILAGGVGARLFPISTPQRPKPFVPLADGESLLTKTLKRIDHPAFLPPLLIGRAADRFALLNHARAAGIAPAAILLETAPCNTAPAMALADAWIAQHHGPRQLMALLPADHLIRPTEDWRATVAQAAQACRRSTVPCLFAAQPQAANPAYGYMRLDSAPVGQAWCQIEEFIEKPEDPGGCIARGARWNMGQLIAEAGQLQAAFSAHAPHLQATAASLLANATPHYEFTELPPWPVAIEPEPFDRVILEHISCVAVNFFGEWQDLGSLPSWQAATGITPEQCQAHPVRTDRPWGYFELLRATPTETVKHLIIYPGCRLSRQRHQQREEHWKVLQGVAKIERDDKRLELEPGQSVHIPRQCWHRLANASQKILIIEEKQIGNCFEEDIEREHDDYGRN